MSIRTKLLLAVGVLLGCGLVVAAAATTSAVRAHMLDRIDTTLQEAVRRPPPPRPESVPQSQRPPTDVETPERAGVAIAVYAPNGGVVDERASGFVDAPDPLPELPADGRDIRTDEFFTTVAAGDPTLEYRALAGRLPEGGTLVVAIPLADLEATMQFMIIVWAITGTSVLVLLLAIGWVLIRRGLAPVADMADTATEIAAGDLSRRVEHTDRRTEIGRLGLALNTMLGRIEAAFAARQASEDRLRDFVADASHELRTPVTAIRGYAELARTGALETPDAVADAMRRIEGESVRMGQLVEDLLLLARLDQGRPLRGEPVDMVPLCSDLVTDLRAVDQERPVRFEHPETAVVIGDEDKLCAVVANLLENAMVHTEAGTPITVEVLNVGAEVTVDIADEGGGLTPEEAARVFDRFYRTPAARSRSEGGSGLGLSIVASVVTAHGGRVQVDTTPGEWTCFRLRLPAAESVRDLAERPQVDA